jgi:acetyl esterase/lipase
MAWAFSGFKFGFPWEYTVPWVLIGENEFGSTAAMGTPFTPNTGVVPLQRFCVVVVPSKLRAEHGSEMPGALLDDVAFMRRHAKLYGIDVSRIIVWGLSAGAYLASMAGTTCHADAFNRRSDDQTISSCVQGVVDWFGPADFNLDGASSSSNIAKCLRCASAECTPKELEAASPTQYVGPETPPFLIMQGAEDRLVLPAQSQQFYNLLRSNQINAQIIIYPGLGHGFQGASSAQLREKLTTTFSFMDRISKR